jgi:hypothetical protein
VTNLNDREQGRDLAHLNNLLCGPSCHKTAFSGGRLYSPTFLYVSVFYFVTTTTTV